jgi:hypothetical protein
MNKPSLELKMECNRCKVAAFCPRRGASPLMTPDGKREFCSIIGGYGREPVDPSILSEQSKRLVESNGPCLTIAEVPVYDNDRVETVMEKVFSPPIKHDRETVASPPESVYDGSYVRPGHEPRY